jgi:hypothetical protein
MVIQLGTLSCGNYGEDTLTASKLDDGSVVIERTNKRGSSKTWTIAMSDTLRVTSEMFAAGMETQVVLLRGDEELAIAHFEVNISDGGTGDTEVAAVVRTLAETAGCTAIIEPRVVPEYMRTPPAPRRPPPPAPPPERPKVMRPVRAGADVLASLATDAIEGGLVRVLRVADGSIVLEDAFTGDAWTIVASDELVLTIWGLSPGPPDYTAITLTRGEHRLPAFYVWNDPTKGLHQAQVVELVNKIADVAGCRVSVTERWD